MLRHSKNITALTDSPACPTGVQGFFISIALNQILPSGKGAVASSVRSFLSEGLFSNPLVFQHNSRKNRLSASVKG